MPNVIVNTSPLIVLNDLDKLHVLRDLYGEIIIPTAVYEEIGAKSDNQIFDIVTRRMIVRKI